MIGSMKIEGKWLGVVGTREVNAVIRADMERFLMEKIAVGFGIVSGGATGADHEAARIAVREGLGAERLRIYLPTTLEVYCAALLRRGHAGKCRLQDAEDTVVLLQQLAATYPGVMYDTTPYSTVDAESFHARNRQIIALADELAAFRVAGSAGTTYSIEQALAKGVPVKVFDY